MVSLPLWGWTKQGITAYTHITHEKHFVNHLFSNMAAKKRKKKKHPSHKPWWTQMSFLAGHQVLSTAPPWALCWGILWWVFLGVFGGFKDPCPHRCHMGGSPTWDMTDMEQYICLATTGVGEMYDQPQLLQSWSAGVYEAGPLALGWLQDWLQYRKHQIFLEVQSVTYMHGSVWHLLVRTCGLISRECFALEFKPNVL